jgi:hypothetical protein
MGKHLYEFTRISLFRMCEHYFPKLKLALDGLNEQVLWKHEKEQLNSIGSIVLHLGQHIQRHSMRYSNDGIVEGGIENYFPVETYLSSSDLIHLITERFNTWREVMNEYLEGSRDHENLLQKWHSDFRKMKVCNFNEIIEYINLSKSKAITVIEEITL